MSSPTAELPRLSSRSARLAILLIMLYQQGWSSRRVAACRYLPSCSSYALTAIERFGLFRGTGLAIRRILRCHPWQRGGYDPVPHVDYPAAVRRSAF